MKRKLTKFEWVQIIEDFKRSDQTQAEFAKSRGLKLCTFRSHLYRKPKKQPQTLSLIEVLPPQPLLEFVEVQFRDVLIRLPADTPRRELVDMVIQLSQAC